MFLTVFQEQLEVLGLLWNSPFRILSPKAMLSFCTCEHFLLCHHGNCINGCESHFVLVTRKFGTKFKVIIFMLAVLFFLHLFFYFNRTFVFSLCWLIDNWLMEWLIDWNRDSCITGWIQTCYVAEDDLKLLIFLLSPPKRWVYSPVPRCLVYMVLGMEPGTGCVLCKYSLY